MNDKIIRFFHVDDEVLRVSWIPSALRTYYYQKHREHFRKASDLLFKQNPYRCSFNLLGQDSECMLEYTLYETGEDLFGLEKSILNDSIIVLDLMALEQDAKGQEPVGNTTLDKLIELGIDKNKVYVLTAFEKMAMAYIGSKLEKEHILTKPIDATTLAPILLKASGVIL